MKKKLLALLLVMILSAFALAEETAEGAEPADMAIEAVAEGAPEVPQEVHEVANEAPGADETEDAPDDQAGVEYGTGADDDVEAMPVEAECVEAECVDAVVVEAAEAVLGEEEELTVAESALVANGAFLDGIEGNGDADNPYRVDSWAKLQTAMNKGGYVQLTGDADITAGSGDTALQVDEYITVNLDLNGHVLSRGLTSPADYGNVITVYGTLTVKDTGTGGRITGGNNKNDGGGVIVYGDFYLEGGAITGNAARNAGGVCVCSKGNNHGMFEMNGGSITGNTATGAGGGVHVDSQASFTMNSGATVADNTAANGGGGVYVRGTFEMDGGVIGGEDAANSASSGGGVYVANTGSFTMNSGATVTSNTATTNGGGLYVSGLKSGGEVISSGSFTMNSGAVVTGNTANNYGGGVYVGKGGNFTLNGGVIGGGGDTANSANTGGGVYVNKDGTIKVSGVPTVTGNTLSDGTTVNNVQLPSGKTIAVAEALSSAASIGVTLGDGYNGAFTNGWKDYMNNADPADYFTSDDADYAVGWNGESTEARLWKAIKYTAKPYSGTYDSAAHPAIDVTVTKPDSGATVTYSLDGKSFSKDIPTITNVGDYTVTYHITATDYAGVSGSVTAKIAVAPEPAPATEPPSVVAPAPAPSGPAVTIAKVPAGVKAKAKKAKVTVSWKKIKKTKKTKALRAQIKSIEVQAATDPSFANIVSIKTVGKTKTKATLKLARKTTYYVRVRYVGNDGGVSNWSKVKRVKTK